MTKRFLEQVCIGYSWNYDTSYYAGLVETDEGKIKVMYSRSTRIGLDEYQSEWTEIEPFVSRLENPGRYQEILSKRG